MSPIIIVIILLLLVVIATSLRHKCTVSILEFNIENEGSTIGLDKVIEVIRLSDADIVAIEEGSSVISTLAKTCGYAYYDVDMQLLSRFPVYRTGNQFRFIEVAPGNLIVISNIHLESDPYGPDALRDGASIEALVDLETRTRLRPLQEKLQFLPMIRRYPTFIIGDFNTPSHLDRPNVPYPVSKYMQSLGFRDSGRGLGVAGHTWWANRVKLPGSWNPQPTDIQDRIDYIYVRGPVCMTHYRTIGEHDVSPWPSDHRAILAKFTLDPLT